MNIVIILGGIFSLMFLTALAIACYDYFLKKDITSLLKEAISLADNDAVLSDYFQSLNRIKVRHGFFKKPDLFIIFRESFLKRMTKEVNDLTSFLLICHYFYSLPKATIVELEPLFLRSLVYKNNAYYFWINYIMPELIYDIEDYCLDMVLSMLKKLPDGMGENIMFGFERNLNEEMKRGSLKLDPSYLQERLSKIKMRLAV